MCQKIIHDVSEKHTQQPVQRTVAGTRFAQILLAMKRRPSRAPRHDQHVRWATGRGVAHY